MLIISIHMCLQSLIKGTIMDQYEKDLFIQRIDNLIEWVTYLSKRIEILEKQVNKIEQTAVTHSINHLEVHSCDE